tara:strand:- start:1510 stop:3396 length:1887 start_codon:yes stop_codon:yes gene_type:complete
MTNTVLAVSLKCSSDNTNLKVGNALTKFLDKATGGLGGAFDMIDGLDSAVGEISDAMEGLTTKVSDLLQNKLTDFISTGLSAAKNFIFNTVFNPIAAIAQNSAFANAALGPISGLMGAFGCLGSTIKKALKGTITNLLTNMIKKGFINPLECAVEGFIGNLTGKIASVMDSIVGPLINPINSLFSIIGKGFGSIKGVIAGGINILSKVNGLLNCASGGGGNCHVAEEYKLNGGSKKKRSEPKKQNSIANSINKFSEKIDDAGTALDEKTGNIAIARTDPITGEEVKTDCNTGNVLDCGLPRIEFFGGGGEGAVGDVILGNFIEQINEQTEIEGLTEGGVIEDVQTTGSIIGVDVTYPGEGYTSEPLVSFVDNCDKGYGAYGRATIDKDPNSPTFGQITGILMISEGENYPTGQISDVFVDKVVVEDGGSGYKLEDEIEDFEVCGVDDNGAITKVCVNDKPYQSLPSLNVNSLTGSGAILTPVMTRRPRQTGVINVIDCITPRGNIVGYVNGKEYNGPFHVMPNGLKMTGLQHSDRDTIIYGTPQESLRSGGAPASNVGSTRIGLRSIQQLVKESETTQTETTQTTENTDLYSDPVDEAGDTPPSTPPSGSPPSGSPPSSGGGGYGGGY